MAHHSMDNGNSMNRRPPWDPLWNPMEYQAESYRRMAQQIARQAAQQPFNRHIDPPMAGMPEPEDITGLKMLEEFLTKRKEKRDGDERK